MPSNKTPTMDTFIPFEKTVEETSTINQVCKQSSKIEERRHILSLYARNYALPAIAHITGLRQDKIASIIGGELICGNLEHHYPEKTIVNKLPISIIKHFPSFPRTGPYCVTLDGAKLVIELLSGK